MHSWHSQITVNEYKRACTNVTKVDCSRSRALTEGIVNIIVWNDNKKCIKLIGRLHMCYDWFLLGSTAWVFCVHVSVCQISHYDYVLGKKPFQLDSYTQFFVWNHICEILMNNFLALLVIYLPSFRWWWLLYVHLYFFCLGLWLESGQFPKWNSESEWNELVKKSTEESEQERERESWCE